MLGILRKYRIKLNPLKCAFGVVFGKFFGYMVNWRRIEVNPEKIKALIDIRSPSSPKEVQSLKERLSALNQLISKATDHCQPFFQTIKGRKRFEWMEECENTFWELKTSLGRPPLLSKPKNGETLLVYLVVSDKAISQIENGYADALSKLASSKDSNLMKGIPVEKLNKPSIDESVPQNVMVINESPEWMKYIIAYLTDQTTPEDKEETRKFVGRL
ncbi:DNA/RNA polymerase superfamily protein [Abeliophyllum distichum]|uniref:DNA/RNA polymerase superfamily protein n=1 Tax=Abeliophyllum distichum TaxID=126358 RepID=A0ABD1TJY4_9LAMI